MKRSNIKRFFLLVQLCLGATTLSFSQVGEDLGKGYSRRGEMILFEGRRIDREGAHDIQSFAQAVGHPLALCRNVDAASFEVLSKEYTKDKNKVYYRWISPGRFWVVEIPGADPETFEFISLSLARDKNHVWKADSIVEGADPKEVKSLFESRIWTDGHSVWNGDRRVEGADPLTFERVSESEFGYYRDAKRVYAYFGFLRVLQGADPKSFRAMGEHGRLAEDKNFRWDHEDRVPKESTPSAPTKAESGAAEQSSTADESK